MTLNPANAQALHSGKRDPVVDADAWLTAAPTLRDRAARFWLWFLMSNSQRWPLFAHITRRFWVWAAWLCSPTLRSVTAANARWLLGERSTAAQRRRLGRRVVNQFFLFVHDMARSDQLSASQLQQHVREAAGIEHYDAARAMGRGVIVATAHFGSYEVGMAALRQREPGPIHVLFQRDRLPQFEGLRRRLHAKLNVTDARVEEGWVTWAKLRDALGRGEVVVMQADRVMPGQKGMAVTFCGGTVNWPTGPVRLAAITGAPIVPIFALRLPDGTVEIAIEPAIMVDGEGRDEAAMKAAVAALAGAIERQVVAHPQQWLVLHRPWERGEH